MRYAFIRSSEICRKLTTISERFLKITAAPTISTRCSCSRNAITAHQKKSVGNPRITTKIEHNWFKDCHTTAVLFLCGKHHYFVVWIPPLWVDKGNVKRLKRVEKGWIELEGVKSGENAWCFGWNEIELEKWTKIEVSKKSLGKWGCPLFSGRFRFGVQFLRAAFYRRLKSVWKCSKRRKYATFLLLRFWTVCFRRK